MMIQINAIFQFIITWIINNKKTFRYKQCGKDNAINKANKYLIKLRETHPNKFTDDADDDKKFNLSIKQLQFIQHDNNVKLMNNIIKLMKYYKLEVEDVNNILEKHVHNEQLRLDKNEARRLKNIKKQIIIKN